MQPHDPTRYNHVSDRANAALEAAKFYPGGKGKLFELALPKMVTLAGQVAAEQMAQRAAARIIQRAHRKLCIIDVWSEDGDHPEHGGYRIWFLLAAPVAGRA